MCVLEIIPPAEMYEKYSEQLSNENSTSMNVKDSGFDLFFPESVELQPRETKFVSLKIKARVVDGDTCYPFWLAPRSSISKTKIRMANSMGIIDKTYRGDLIVALDNTSDQVVQIGKGKRLFQICSHNLLPFNEVKIVETLDMTRRGSGGVGSTGNS